MTTRRITRAELYELVWRTPISQLAREFGMSDVALAKTCRRLSIPRPGRGYWAQKAAGLKLKQPPLGKAPPGTRESVLFEQSGSHAPAAPKVKAPTVEVPPDLRSAPDAVQHLGAALGSARKDEHERLVVSGRHSPVLAVTIAAHRRALLLLAALARAAMGRGHSVAFRDDAGVHALVILVGDTAVELSLVECLGQRDHQLTPDEQRRLAGGFGYRIPKYDHFASGRLQMSLLGIGGLRSSWSDTEHRRLDQHFGTVLVAAEAEVERRRRQRLADEARREEQERRRLEEEEARRRERLRVARAQHQERLAADLQRMARAWSEADEIRRFVQAVRESAPSGEQDERFDAWLRWADAYVRVLDPLSRIKEIAKDVEFAVEEPPHVE